MIWGPINYSSQYGLILRIIYLIVIPIIVWFLLKWVWILWEPNDKSEIRLENILAFLTTIILLIMALYEFMSATHVGNTLWVRSPDGMEAVGDDIILPGPDWGSIIILLLCSGISLWFGITNKPTKQKIL